MHKTIQGWAMDNFGIKVTDHMANKLVEMLEEEKKEELHKIDFDLRCGCGKIMRFNNGHAHDPQNCRYPYFGCKCGNEVDVLETEPQGE